MHNVRGVGGFNLKGRRFEFKDPQAAQFGGALLALRAERDEEFIPWGLSAVRSLPCVEAWDFNVCLL